MSLLAFSSILPSCLGSGKSAYLALEYPGADTWEVCRPQCGPLGKLCLHSEYIYSILSLWQSVWLSAWGRLEHPRDQLGWYTCFSQSKETFRTGVIQWSVQTLLHAAEVFGSFSIPQCRSSLCQAARSSSSFPYDKWNCRTRAVS